MLNSSGHWAKENRSLSLKQQGYLKKLLFLLFFFFTFGSWDFRAHFKSFFQMRKYLFLKKGSRCSYIQMTAEAETHTECFGLEGTFRGHLAQPPCSEQGQLMTLRELIGLMQIPWWKTVLRHLLFHMQNKTGWITGWTLTWLGWRKAEFSQGLPLSPSHDDERFLYNRESHMAPSTVVFSGF